MSLIDSIPAADCFGAGLLHIDGVSYPWNNMILQEAAAVKAAALTGSRKVDTVYFLYSNAVLPLSLPAKVDTMTAVSLQALFATGTEGILRCSVVAASNPSSDISRFVAIATGSQMAGSAVLTAGLSHFFGAVLVSAGAVSDEDLAMSIVYFGDSLPFTEIQHVVGRAAGIDWNIVFNRT